jgi:hypothetical protein
MPTKQHENDKKISFGENVESTEQMVYLSSWIFHQAFLIKDDKSIGIIRTKIKHNKHCL